MDLCCSDSGFTATVAVSDFIIGVEHYKLILNCKKCICVLYFISFLITHSVEYNLPSLALALADSNQCIVCMWRNLNLLIVLSCGFLKNNRTNDKYRGISNKIYTNEYSTLKHYIIISSPSHIVLRHPAFMDPKQV